MDNLVERDDLMQGEGSCAQSKPNGNWTIWDIKQMRWKAEDLESKSDLIHNRQSGMQREFEHSREFGTDKRRDSKSKSWNTNTNKWEIQNLKFKEKLIERAEYGMEKDMKSIWKRCFAYGFNAH
jgi:hypothetical protein